MRLWRRLQQKLLHRLLRLRLLLQGLRLLRLRLQRLLRRLLRRRELQCWLLRRRELRRGEGLRHNVNAPWGQQGRQARRRRCRRARGEREEAASFQGAWQARRAKGGCELRQLPPPRR